MKWQLILGGMLIAAQARADAEYDAWVARFMGATQNWFAPDSLVTRSVFMSDGFVGVQDLAHTCFVTSGGNGRGATASSFSQRGYSLPQMSGVQIANRLDWRREHQRDYAERVLDCVPSADRFG